MIEHLIWTEKYRPQNVQDTIMPERLKKIFSGFVEQGHLPNLIMTGPPGLGKTTLARAVISELGGTSILINGSLDGTKDTLRNEIKEFATNKSMRGGRKYVILDEADGLTAQMQPALRTFMEEYSSNVSFILTCNNPYKIIEALHSRSSVIEFTYTSKEKAEILKQVFDRMCMILDTEKVDYNKKVILEVIKKRFPDIRRIINELQKYASCNEKIDVGILADVDENSILQVLEYMKNKNFPAIRKWVSECDIEDNDLYKKVYDIGERQFTPNSLPTLILLLAEYQRYSPIVANRDINTAAALTDIAINCEFL